MNIDAHDNASGNKAALVRYETQNETNYVDGDRDYIDLIPIVVEKASQTTSQNFLFGVVVLLKLKENE